MLVLPGCAPAEEPAEEMIQEMEAPVDDGVLVADMLKDWGEPEDDDDGAGQRDCPPTSSATSRRMSCVTSVSR